MDLGCRAARYTPIDKDLQGAGGGAIGLAVCSHNTLARREIYLTGGACRATTVAPARLMIALTHPLPSWIGREDRPRFTGELVLLTALPALGIGVLYRNKAPNYFVCDKYSVCGGKGGLSDTPFHTGPSHRRQEAVSLSTDNLGVSRFIAVEFRCSRPQW